MRFPNIFIINYFMYSEAQNHTTCKAVFHTVSTQWVCSVLKQNNIYKDDLANFEENFKASFLIYF